ncbi:MAG: ABC transporter permease, partial [Acidimicrobiales bacterium]
MTGRWLLGLLRRRTGRVLATAGGIAIGVALTAALGTFLTASQSTMTARALRSVTVAWQVEVQPGGDLAAVRHELRDTPGVTSVERVGLAKSPGFRATTGGTTQTTGAGVV